MMRTLAVAGLLALGGCSSVYDLAGGTDGGPQVFGGVRTWPEDVRDTFGGPGSCAGYDYYILVLLEGGIDIPCSLAGDLLLLPVTLVFEIFRN